MCRINQGGSVFINTGIHKKADQRRYNLFVKVIFQFIHNKVSALYEAKQRIHKNINTLNSTGRKIFFYFQRTIQYNLVRSIKFQANVRRLLFRITFKIFNARVQECKKLLRKYAQYVQHIMIRPLQHVPNRKVRLFFLVYCNHYTDIA